MILIQKNSTNKVILTLNEKKLDPSNTVTITFTNDVTKSAVVFQPTDVSISTDRYNEFYIVEDVLLNQDLINVIYLRELGYYSYSVAEDNTSPVNPLETGKVLVIDDTIVNNQFNTSGDSDVNVVNE